jgi:hypothetical protein
MHRQERLEAVTVSVGYADILKHTIEFNKHHFDKWVIATSPEDKDTQKLARLHNLTLLVTDDAKRDGSFSKGRVVERALQHLSANTWVLHLDGDIVLPADFRKWMQNAHLDPQKIYGADRVMIHSCEEWKKLKDSGWLWGATKNHPHEIKFPSGFGLASRWGNEDGYVPSGYFQLWHRIHGGEEDGGARLKPYPMGHGTAAREDIQHGLKWDRRHRQLIPEIVVVHLESEARPRSNWHGRTQLPFCTDKMPTAAVPGALTPGYKHKHGGDESGS